MQMLIDGLVQYCIISIANALDIRQSFTTSFRTCIISLWRNISECKYMMNAYAIDKHLFYSDS